MCGIAGYSGKDDAFYIIATLLKEMEYRGYDSCGIALGRPDVIVKTVGTVDKLKKVEGFGVGIGHTRWATHGEVSEENAHPHLSCDGRIAIVHNGIITNHVSLRKKLVAHDFKSQTDSEVIAHLLEEYSIPEVMEMLEGDYAVAGIMDGRLFAMKHGSPLVVGFRNGDMFIASDPISLAGFVESFVVMDDGEYMIDGKFFRGGRTVDKRPLGMVGFGKSKPKRMKHFMLQEIHEQLEMVELIRKAGEWKKLNPGNHVLIASGSSYNASLFYSYILNELFDSRAVIASEATRPLLERAESLIAVSQSGETADVIKAVKGLNFTAVVNIPYSTLDRMASKTIYMHAGRERAVAATKTFLAELSIFSLSMFPEVDLESPVRKALKYEEEIRRIASSLAGSTSMYVLGRNENYAIAEEISLKIKEIAYVHAEAFPSGEMKHGPLALVEKGFPAIVIASSERDVAAAEELASRGADVIVLSSQEINGFHSVPSGFDGIEHSIFSAVVGQLLAYYMADAKGLPIDRPRNLAKSVTVI